MQATTVHNLKKSVGLDPDKEVLTFGMGKGDMLQVICYSLWLLNEMISITWLCGSHIFVNYSHSLCHIFYFFSIQNINIMCMPLILVVGI